MCTQQNPLFRTVDNVKTMTWVVPLCAIVAIPLGVLVFWLTYIILKALGFSLSFDPVVIKSLLWLMPLCVVSSISVGLFVVRLVSRAFKFNFYPILGAISGGACSAFLVLLVNCQ